VSKQATPPSSPPRSTEPQPEPAKEEPVKVVETQAEKASESQEDAEASNDDLARLSGIGPKLAEMMKQAGITSFNQLAAMTADEVSQRLGTKARYSKVLAETWAEQAKLAAEGDWAGLKSLQTTYKG
jgi:predicted flap endonuclease-1-like 5' DNA nuclease